MLTLKEFIIWRGLSLTDVARELDWDLGLFSHICAGHRNFNAEYIPEFIDILGEEVRPVLEAMVQVTTEEKLNKLTGLKKLIYTQGYTISKLAKSLTVCTATVQDWCASRTSIPSYHEEPLLKLLGDDVRDFFGGESKCCKEFTKLIYKNKFTILSFAKDMGVSRDTVNSWIHKINRIKFTYEDRLVELLGEEVKQFFSDKHQITSDFTRFIYNKGYTIRSLSEAVGVNKGRVGNWVLRGRGIPKKYEQSAIELFGEEVKIFFKERFKMTKRKKRILKTKWLIENFEGNRIRSRRTSSKVNKPDLLELKAKLIKTYTWLDYRVLNGELVEY